MCCVEGKGFDDVDVDMNVDLDENKNRQVRAPRVDAG